MKTSMKILAASMALASLGMSGVANAKIQVSAGAGTYVGPGELFMTAWDAAAKQSYSRDLGIFQTDLLTNPGQPLSYNLNMLDTGVADANWAKFISTGSKGAGVVFTVTSANIDFYGPIGFLTTSPSTVADIRQSSGNYSQLSGSANTINMEGQALNGNAYDVNGASFADAATNVGVNLSTFSVPGNGGYFDIGTWGIKDGGKSFLTIGNIDDNNGVPFYSSLLSMTDYSSVNITKLPNVWKLDSAGNLKYVSAVPVPAAAWLFGSGLLGLVSVARRRKV